MLNFFPFEAVPVYSFTSNRWKLLLLPQEVYHILGSYQAGRWKKWHFGVVWFASVSVFSSAASFALKFLSSSNQIPLRSSFRHFSERKPSFVTLQCPSLATKVVLGIHSLYLPNTSILELSTLEYNLIIFFSRFQGKDCILFIILSTFPSPPKKVVKCLTF